MIRQRARKLFETISRKEGDAVARVGTLLPSPQYDGMGDRQSLWATIGGVKDFVNNYSYDNLSRLYDIVQQGQGGNAVAPKQVYYTLDGVGDVTELDRWTSTTVGATRTGPAYSLLSYSNATGQLQSIAHENTGGVLDTLTYGYDGVGRVQTFTSKDGQATYGYDPMSQLISATYSTAGGGHQPTNESYSFDTNGNRLSANGTNTTSGPGNHLASDGTYNFVYDWNGNLVSQTPIPGAPSSAFPVSYTWDSANRLVEVQDFNSSGTLTQQVGYAYDVFDHLIERVDEVVGSSTSTRHYVWDLLSAVSSVGNALSGVPGADGGIVLAFDGNQNLTNRYLNGPNTSAHDQYYTTQAEEDVSTPSQQGTVAWDLLDALGSVRDIVNSRRTLVDHIVYNSNGVVAYEQNSSVSRLLGWQGGIDDTATGEEDFGVRWYNAVDAVWNNPDPIGFMGGGTNLTESRGNDPANAIDRSGFDPAPLELSGPGMPILPGPYGAVAQSAMKVISPPLAPTPKIEFNHTEGNGFPSLEWGSYNRLWPRGASVRGSYTTIGKNTASTSISVTGPNVCNTVSTGLNFDVIAGVLTASLKNYPAGFYNVSVTVTVAVTSDGRQPYAKATIYLPVGGGTGNSIRPHLEALGQTQNSMQEAAQIGTSPAKRADMYTTTQVVTVEVGASSPSPTVAMIIPTVTGTGRGCATYSGAISVGAVTRSRWPSYGGPPTAGLGGGF